MAGDVRIQQAQGFLTFAQGVRVLASDLEALDRRHTPLDLQPPDWGSKLADLSTAVGRLSTANEALLGRLARYVTGAHRGLGGLAYTGDWIGVRFPGVDLAAKQKLAGLVGEAKTAVPALPADAPGKDPRFESLPVTP
jgi:hypothetical protein